MVKVNFKKQKEIIEWEIKSGGYSKEYLEGYINALFDYILINDDQFDELYNLITKGGEIIK